MENIYYTYAYLREDRTPYYIGRGKGKRAFDKRHIGYPPTKDRIIFLKTGLTFSESIQHEIYMISVFGRKNNGTGILHNLTEGGEGAKGLKHSKETKQKMSLAKRGMKFSPEHKENLSIALTGRKQPEAQVVNRTKSLPRGEKHHMWKISAEDRREIVRRHIPRSSAGNGNTRELAEEFSTTPITIRRIVKDQRWIS